MSASPRFKPDKQLRDKLFTAGSYSHPAKGHLGLWWEILERYTKAGDLVLDPMAGVGATMLGALMGRNVICVELEPHFTAPMKASWQKMRQNLMLGSKVGEVTILRGDAKALPLARADCVVTSPPYAEGLGHGSKLGRIRDIVRSRSIHDGHYDYNQGIGENIGNLRGPKYWEAMRQVYSECRRVLAPGGLMVLVVKGFTKDGKYVDLPEQTRSLCESLGFSFVETWQRELWNVSFWRILQKRNNSEGWDERLRFETVLVLRNT